MHRNIGVFIQTAHAVFIPTLAIWHVNSSWVTVFCQTSPNVPPDPKKHLKLIGQEITAGRHGLTPEFEAADTEAKIKEEEEADGEAGSGTGGKPKRGGRGAGGGRAAAAVRHGIPGQERRVHGG